MKGISGLRVIDASVMPKIVGGNTNAATIMIGERGADMIVRDAKKNELSIKDEVDSEEMKLQKTEL